MPDDFTPRSWEEFFKEVDDFNPRSWEEFFKEFKYKPNFYFEFEYSIDMNWDTVLVMAIVPDVYHPEKQIAIQQKFPLPSWRTMNIESAARAVRHAIQELELHEVDENITVAGERIFDPHAPLMDRKITPFVPQGATT